jgi:flagellar basal body-associated protein FliL
MEKKKKIQIAIIVVCFMASAGILYWSFGGVGNPGSPEEFIATTGTSGVVAAPQVVTEDSKVEGLPTNTPNDFTAPTVFPQQVNLDLSVYDSSAFTRLQDYTPLTVSPGEIGRENPFRNP